MNPILVVEHPLSILFQDLKFETKEIPIKNVEVDENYFQFFFKI